MITVSVEFNCKLEETWEYWTKPAHVKGWNFTSPEWQCPEAKSDFREGGEFSYRSVLNTTVKRFFVSQYRCFFKSRIITLPNNINFREVHQELERKIHED